MRKFILSTIFIFLVFPICSHAYKNEPDGFRKLKWGVNLYASKTSFTRLKTFNQHDKLYKNDDDKLQIGGAKLNYIYYRFYKNKLASVSMKTKGVTNKQALLLAVQTRFGKGQKLSAVLDRFIWIGKKTDIYIQCDIMESCDMIFASKEQQKIIGRDKKKQANDAGKDF